MTISWWYRSALVCGFSVASLAASPAIVGAQPALFVEAPRAPAASEARAPEIVRSRRLAVRTDLLVAALRPGAQAAAPFTLNLFPDVSLTLVRERVEGDSRGYSTWIGSVAGDSGSVASLTWHAGTLAGGVVAGGVTYDITTGDDGIVAVSQRAVTAPPVELPPVVPARFAEARTAAPATAGDATAAIDLLVLYTAAARDRAGSEALITAQLANAVAVTNTAFQRSGINAVITAVGIQELPLVEGAGLGSDLSAISLGGTHSAAVEGLRTALGADLVALVTGRASSSGGCGMAWIGPSSSAAYSVSEQACLYAGQWSFSHEIGHNLGADHAPGDSSPVGAAYAHGYRDASIRTLMAYAVYGSPQRLLNYSSDTVLEPAGTGLPTGNSLQDNARRLDETVAAVAGYLPSSTPGLAPAAPTGLTANVTGPSVALSWTAVANATAYLVQIGTAPGDVSVYSTKVSGPSLSGPIPAGSYYWRVRAENAYGTSPASAEGAFAVTASAPPAAPVGFAAQVNGSTVSLSWAAGAGGGVSSYVIEAGPSQGSAAYGALALTQTAISIPNVPNGTYYLRVRAAGPGGTSAPTADAVVTVGAACTVPGTSTVSAQVGAGTVTLNWTTPSGTGPFSYQLAVGSTAGGTEYGVHGMGGATTVSARPPSGTYFVRVLAANACGSGAASASTAIVVP